MTSKDFTIGVLSTTAVILLVGIFIIHSRPQSAFASGMTERGGGFTMTVGSVSIDDEEVVFVIDSTSKKMLVYRFDTRSLRVRIVSGVDLARLREGAAPGKSSGKKKSRKRRRP